MAGVDRVGAAAIDDDVFDVGDMDDIQSGNLRSELMKTKIKSFYESLSQEPPEIIDPNDFEYENDNLYLKNDDGRIQLTNKRDPTKFLAKSTLRRNLDIMDQDRLGIRVDSNLRSQAVAKLQESLTELPGLESVPLRDLTQVADQVISHLNETILSDSDQTALKTLDDPPLPMRELLALDKRLQSIRGELTNNVAKLSELDSHILKEKEKLATADEENLGLGVKERIIKRLGDLQQERSARLEVLSESRNKLRTQVNRIRETIEKVLYENTTLMERIQTLFREQGITIASILTAIGFAISTLVYALTGGGSAGGGGAGGGSAGSSGEGESWIKKQLNHIQNLLKRLADKVIDSLPGIIGSVISWILSTAGKVVGYVANHLWIAAVGLGVLLLQKVKIN